MNKDDIIKILVGVTVSLLVALIIFITQGVLRWFSARQISVKIASVEIDDAIKNAIKNDRFSSVKNSESIKEHYFSYSLISSVKIANNSRLVSKDFSLASSDLYPALVFINNEANFIGKEYPAVSIGTILPRDSKKVSILHGYMIGDQLSFIHDGKLLHPSFVANRYGHFESKYNFIFSRIFITSVIIFSIFSNLLAKLLSNALMGN